MNIYVAITLFSFTILLYWVMSELFTMLFRFTGLPDERARFQVTSLLTGTGFTTRESEMLLTTKRRRRIARIMMLFGYVFNITIVSAFINVLFSVNMTQAEHFMASLMIPLAAVALIFIFIRFPVVRSWGNELLAKLAGKVMFSDSGNRVLLIDYIGQDSIAQVRLNSVPEELREKTLAQMQLRAEHGILVMLVEGNGHKAIPVHGDTIFLEGDRLTVFGNFATICKVFEAQESFDDQ